MENSGSVGTASAADIAARRRFLAAEQSEQATQRYVAARRALSILEPSNYADASAIEAAWVEVRTSLSQIAGRQIHRARRILAAETLPPTDDEIRASLARLNKEG